MYNTRCLMRRTCPTAEMSRSGTKRDIQVSRQYFRNRNLIGQKMFQYSFVIGDFDTHALKNVQTHMSLCLEKGSFIY